MNKFFTIIKYGIKKRYIWSLVMFGIFIFNMSVNEWTFILSNIITAIFFGFIIIYEIYEMRIKRKSLMYLESYAKKNPQEASFGALSWRISHNLSFITLALLIGVVFSNFNQTFIFISSIAWWVYYLQIITRSYYNTYLKKSYDYVESEIKNAFDKFKNEKDDDE
ncbi:MAG: hypothetical protein ACOC3V_04715 [bacterium]